MVEGERVAGAVVVEKADRVVLERHLPSMPGGPRRARLRTGMEGENLLQSLLGSHLRGVWQVVVPVERYMEPGVFLCSSRSRYSVLTSQFVGSREYGSGYPGIQGRGVNSRGFPFFFWPLAWGGLGGGFGAAYLHTGEVSCFIFESHGPPSKHLFSTVDPTIPLVQAALCSTQSSHPTPRTPHFASWPTTPPSQSLFPISRPIVLHICCRARPWHPLRTKTHSRPGHSPNRQFNITEPALLR